MTAELRVVKFSEEEAKRIQEKLAELMDTIHAVRVDVSIREQLNPNMSRAIFYEIVMAAVKSMLECAIEGEREFARKLYEHMRKGVGII